MMKKKKQKIEQLMQQTDVVGGDNAFWDDDDLQAKDYMENDGIEVIKRTEDPYVNSSNINPYFQNQSELYYPQNNILETQVMEQSNNNINHWNTTKYDLQSSNTNYNYQNTSKYDPQISNLETNKQESNMNYAGGNQYPFTQNNNIRNQGEDIFSNDQHNHSYNNTSHVQNNNQSPPVQSGINYNFGFNDQPSNKSFGQNNESQYRPY